MMNSWVYNRGLIMSTTPAQPRTFGMASEFAWTLAETVQLLQANPHDAYLQYVAFQLAQREGRTHETISMLRDLNAPAARGARPAPPDILALFSGALAVQECLQLDVLQRSAGAGQTAGNGFQGERHVDELKGAGVRSHPWKAMLCGRVPEVSRLSKMVPADFLFVECRSLNAVFETVETISRWADTVSLQVMKSAVGGKLSWKLQVELGLLQNRTGKLNDLVSEVALVTSDLFAADGSDMSVLFWSDRPDELKACMSESLEKTQADYSAQRRTGNYGGVEYWQIESDNRQLNAFCAEPVPGLHLRSNSLPALRRIIDTVTGSSAGVALGASDEFGYIRTLMPWRHEKEDVFVYLSDPFIRRLIGPQLRIAARRKFMCRNHLSMLEQAIRMYCTEYGRLPDSTDTLAAAACAPLINSESLNCPDGGYYSLVVEGDSVIPACSRHGRSGHLLACLETPVGSISALEARDYEQFLEQYNRYWSTYFDPIAIRLKSGADFDRAETIVLPLIDNSIYTQLAGALGGKTESLDGLPVPGRNILTTAFRFNKRAIIDSHLDERTLKYGAGFLFPSDPAAAASLDLEDFLLNVLQNQVALHVYDSVPMLSLDFSAFMGIFATLVNRPGGGRANPVFPPNGIWLWAAFLIASLNAPVYLSFPVDSQKSSRADLFLSRLHALMSRQLAQQSARSGFAGECYKCELDDGGPAYCSTFQIGPAKLRIHWARIGQAIYVASKSFILNDLSLALRGVGGDRTNYSDAQAVAHAMVRFRPGNWNEVKQDMSVNQAETNRASCLNNLTKLCGLYRAQLSLGAGASAGNPAQHSDRFCPDGGEYVVEKRQIVCTCHGSAGEPKQPQRGSEVKFMGDAGAVTAQLSFLQDGLRAVLTIDRRQAAG
jgi:hypothetical protein